MTNDEIRRHARQRLAGAALSGALVFAGVALMPSSARAASACDVNSQVGANVTLTWTEKGATPNDPSTMESLSLCDDSQVGTSRYVDEVIADPSNVYGTLVQQGSADMRIGEMKAYANNASAWYRETYVAMADIVTFDVADFAKDELGYATVTMSGLLDGIFNNRSAMSSVTGTLFLSAYNLAAGAEPISSIATIGLGTEQGWNVYLEDALSFDISVRDGEQWLIETYFWVAAANTAEWAGSYASGDLLHTATVSMEGQGVTWTSQTGEFLADRVPSTGSVPEPATWAMLMAGFGLVGSLARSRARRVQFA